MDAAAGRVCWIDLAASDAERAKSFYGALFGWTARDQAAHGGVFTRLHLGGHDVGSLYQLGRAQLEQGVPSHWTPYVQVADVASACRRAESLGGERLVSPFEVDGVARIALVADPVGAMVGLWQDLRAGGHDGQ
jgi:predicted enzyme related to lactoylglutathione lyase